MSSGMVTPPTEHVEIDWGEGVVWVIPFHQHLTPGEHRELDEVFRNTRNIGGFAQDLDTLRVFVRYRTEYKWSDSWINQRRVDTDKISEAVERLSVPFAMMMRRKALRRWRMEAASLSLSQLTALRTEYVEFIETLEVLIAERKISPQTTTGSSSRPS